MPSIPLLRLEDGMMRLPDGKITADLDEYHDAWLSLGQQVEDLFPGYVMYGYNPGLSFTKDYGDSLRLSVQAARTLIARVKQQPVEELTTANETIDMLYERSGRFAAQADKYEQELKAAKEEKAEAIRLGDERLAELWDMKQKEIKSLKAEIIRLRRHLGEIP